MVKEASVIVDNTIGIKKGEKVTIAKDSGRTIEAEVLASVSNARGAEVLVVDISPYVIPWQTGRYADPPEHFKELVKSSNVTLVVTDQEFSQRFSHSVHHFLNQTEECSVYQIDEGMGTWDYSAEDALLIADRSKQIMNAFRSAKTVRVTSPGGTNVTLSIERRDCLPVTPIMPRAPTQSATPIPLWGELNWAPIEDLTEGRVIIDGILMRSNSESAVNNPVEWIVKGGRIVKVSGGKEADDFRKALEAADENAYVIGELGIGTGHKARFGRMEEKGRLGTVHLGVGNNKGVYPGGTNVSKIHGDGSIRNVTVEVDGRKIIEREEVLL